jgi:hypothetical protein
MQARLERLPPAPLTMRPTDVFVATFPKCGTTWSPDFFNGWHFNERQMVAATSRLLGLPPDAGTTKVRSGRVEDGRDALPASVVTRLDEAWRREIKGPLGIRAYDELRTLCRPV